MEKERGETVVVNGRKKNKGKMERLKFENNSIDKRNGILLFLNYSHVNLNREEEKRKAAMV